jgi:hypothetical protein
MSSVTIAGRMLYATADSSEQVLAFYRAALPLLGWEERSADAEKIAANRDTAGLTVITETVDGKTQILMQLLDAVD